jgi:hypothetical protein
MDSARHHCSFHSFLTFSYFQIAPAYIIQTYYEPLMAKGKKKFHSSGLHQVIVRRVGASFVWLAIVSLLLLHGNDNIFHAFGVAGIPWILESIYSLLTREPQRYGFSLLANLSRALVHLAFSLATMYGGEDMQRVLVGALIVWLCLNGAGFTIFPHVGAIGIWHVASLDNLAMRLFSLLGYALLSNAVVLMMVDSHVDVVGAMGFGYAVIALGQVVDLQKPKGSKQQQQFRYLVLTVSILLAALMVQAEIPGKRVSIEEATSIPVEREEAEAVIE